MSANFRGKTFWGNNLHLQLSSFLRQKIEFLSISEPVKFRWPREEVWWVRRNGGGWILSGRGAGEMPGKHPQFLSQWEAFKWLNDQSERRSRRGGRGTRRSAGTGWSSGRGARSRRPTDGRWDMEYQLLSFINNETRGTLPGAPPFYTFDLIHVEKNISIGLILSLIIMSTFT